MKNLLLALFLLIAATTTSAQPKPEDPTFPIRGFHLDLRVQVMTMDALKDFALKLKKSGINTLVMEWEGTYPYEKHPLIPNKYAYSKEQVTSFIKYCNTLGIDVIPLQQSFGHVEYILRHERYKVLREDQRDYSQVCPLETEGDSALFTDLYTELASTHTSKYIHIGGDETYLLGHDDKCRMKAAREGKSKLYADYIKLLCDIVIKLGKRPVLWADIALAYPDAIKSLPKETVFIDWNYGWDLNRFGDHQKLMESGFEIWGSPALRSSPDNYNLTLWEKHFKNIRDFIPTARKLGYKGMVMTSWSTSGAYSPVFESDGDIADLYAIRHVYPLSGFNILIAAYSEALKSTQPLNIEDFIQRYCKDHFGFNKEQADAFWTALKTSPYEIRQGEVIAPYPMSVQQLFDSNRTAEKTLYALHPAKNQEEYEHFKLMADIRDYYLRYQAIEKLVNEPTFNDAQKPAILEKLKGLLANSKNLDDRFILLNKGFLTPSEIEEENQIRNIKINNLYKRLSRKTGISLL
jgi:hexosaminidase